MEDGRLMGLISFVVGVALGANWGKIRKWMPKAKQSVKNLAENTTESVIEVATKATDAVVNAAECVTEAVGDTAKAVFHKPEPAVKRARRVGRKARAAHA